MILLNAPASVGDIGDWLPGVANVGVSGALIGWLVLKFWPAERERDREARRQDAETMVAELKLAREDFMRALEAERQERLLSEERFLERLKEDRAENRALVLAYTESLKAIAASSSTS